MGIKYSKEQRDMIIKHTIGKQISNLYFVEEGAYWVMDFTDGTEMSFKFMAELV